MCALVTASLPGHAFAQPAEPAPAAPARPAEPASPAPAQPAASAPPAESAKPAITVGGYIEDPYQLQLQDASNRITNLGGFDNRSRMFMLCDVALDANDAVTRGVTARSEEARCSIYST